MKNTSLILAFILFIISSSSVIASDTYTSSVETSASVLSQNEQAMEYSNRASIKFLKKDINGAITDFNRAIEISPNNPNLYLNRGYIKQLIKDFDGALDDYNAALKINSKFAFALNNRGVLRAILGDISGAMSDYEKALEINPKYADVYYNRGNLKYLTNDNKGALADYDKAIEYNPKDSDAYNNRGVVKKRMNFNVGALSDYSQAIAINPNDSIAYANRGRLKKLYFDNEGAAIDLDQAVALAENQVFIKNVKPLLSKDTYIAALPTFDKTEFVSTSKSKPSNVSKVVNEKLPVVAQKVEKTAQNIKKPVAEKVAKNIDIKQNSKEEIAQSKTPTIVAGVGTVKVATPPDITTSVVKTNPTTNVKLAESYYIRGLQKCVLRDLQGAIADLNKAIENNSKYADAYFYRAAIKRELGDSDGFKKDYTTAIQINPSLQTFNDLDAISLISG